MNRLLYLAIFCFVFIASLCPGYADNISDLYSANITTTSQSDQAVVQAMSQGLQQVLLKLHGNAEILNNPAIKQALANPNAYVLQYGYQQSPDAGQGMFLHITFDQKALNNLLNSSGQAVLSSSRPLTLAWVVVNDHSANAPYLLSAENVNNFAGILMQTAKQNGLPLLLPEDDLDDMQVISIQDITQNNTAAILQASKRYNSDAILTVSLRNSDPSHWQSTWNWSLQGQNKQWQFQGNSAAAVISSGMNAIINSLAGQYGVKASNNNPEDITLIVSNVQDMQQYASLTQYLKQLAPIKAVNVVEVGQSDVTVTVTVAGGAAALTQALEFSRQLKTAANAANNNKTLYYQWQS